MAARNALKLFNGKIAVNDIFALKSADDVKGFVHTIVQSPEAHGVAKQNEAECVRALKDFLEFDFTNPSKTPLFFIKDDALDPKRYTRNGIEFGATSPFQSFVHGLSLMKVPTDATRESFYLPLAAAIGNALYTVGGKRSPNRLSIIFEEDRPNADISPFIISTADPTYIMGTNIPQAGKKAKPNWKALAQETNWHWLKETIGLPFNDPKKSYLNPDEYKRGQLFGHCAETHAFVIKLLTTAPSKRDHVSGFTLRNEALKVAGTYEGVLNTLEDCVQDPCENCMKAIIGHFETDPRRFLVEAKDYFKF